MFSKIMDRLICKLKKLKIKEFLPIFALVVFFLKAYNSNLLLNLSQSLICVSFLKLKY